MSVEEELVGFLRKKFSTDIEPDDPLIDRGLLDSMALLEVLTFIEERTGARVPDDEVIHDNFQSVRSMGRLIQRLGSQGS